MFKPALVLVLTAGLAAPAFAQNDRCAPVRAGEQCGEGNGRQTAGGGTTGNVSHKGWPPITGILWKVLDSGDHERTGTADNDELLGHHGNDKVVGGAGKDVLWGDWELKGNGSNQSDVLRGGDGNDFLYPSHGKNLMYGGAGNDRIIAYYGHGVIDCGPGANDYAQTRWQSSAYTVRNCERVRHFCAFGSKPNGDCKKPGEKASLSLDPPIPAARMIGGSRLSRRP
jgi:Ca2+-binding RTX toxin-like protein